MASLMHANLPSEDEEDDDYDPSADPTGEKDPSKQQNSASRKRGRGLAVVDDEAVADGGTADDEQQPAARPAAAKEAVEAKEDVITPAQAAKKAKISAMWDQLHQASTGSTNQLSKNSISLASLCSNTDPKKKKNTDVVSVQVDKDSKEAKQAAERSAAAATGLDSFLKQIESKKKVTVLDKSKMDWQDFKQTDTDVQEELEAHRRSDKQYLDKQDFLKRAELREYEIERDKRLASDVRLRGRL
eukprot:gene3497-3766_t